MIEQKTVTIDGEEYMLTQLPATKGIKVLKQIIKLVGPAFAELSKGDGDDIVSLALDKLFDNIDEVDVEQLVIALASTASKGSMSVNFDQEFSGKYDRLFKLVKEVVEFNFGSVFMLVGSELQ